MRRSLALVLGWFAATVVAVSISWAGVRIVAAQVVEPLPVAIGGVAVEPSPATSPSPTPAPPPEPSPTPTPTPEGIGQPVPRDTASDADESDGSPPPPAEQVETRTYSLVGGTVTVEFSSTSVRVIQATPNSGFTRDVDQEGAMQIEVEFRGEEHRSRLEAWWDGGPRSEIDEDADDGGSGED